MDFKNLLKEWQNKKSLVNEISQAAVDVVGNFGRRRIVPLQEGKWNAELERRLKYYEVLQSPKLDGKLLTYNVVNEYGAKPRSVSIVKWAKKLTELQKLIPTTDENLDKNLEKQLVNMGFMIWSNLGTFNPRYIRYIVGTGSEEYERLLQLKKTLANTNYHSSPSTYRQYKADIERIERDSIRSLPLEYVVEKYMLDLNGSGDDTEFYIMISENPIDVVRMSDSPDLRTCHSEGSDYFKSAVEAAAEEEQIAYVVTRESVQKLAQSMGLDTVDIEKINKSFLEEWMRKEVIPDPCRKVEGVEGFWPVSRLRYRPYTLKTDRYGDRLHIQVPYATAVKGKRVQGFSDTLLKMAIEEYKEDIKELLKIDEENGEIEEEGLYAGWYGGSYQDENVDDLILGFLKECFPNLDVDWYSFVDVYRDYDSGSNFATDEYETNRLWQVVNDIKRQMEEYLDSLNTETLQMSMDLVEDYDGYGEDPMAYFKLIARVKSAVNPNWSKDIYEDEEDFIEILGDYCEELDYDGSNEDYFEAILESDQYFISLNDDFAEINKEVSNWVNQWVEHFSTQDTINALFSDFDKDMGQIILPFNFLERLPRMYWRSTADQEGEAALEEMFKPVLEKENKIMKKSFRDLEKKGISFHFIVDPFYVGEEITKEQINLKIRGTSDATNICIKLSEQSLARYLKFIQNNLDKIKATIFHFMKKRYESVNNLEAFKADRERIEIGINNLLHSHEEKMKKYIVNLYEKLESDQDEEDEEDY